MLRNRHARRWGSFLTGSLVLALLAPGCATTLDPERRTDVRRQIDRRVEGHFSPGGVSGADDCYRDPRGDRCRRWRAFATDLTGLAAQAPRDRHAMGQVVYALVRGGGHQAALSTLAGCRVPGWWCPALQGWVLAELGGVVQAEAAFHRALNVMPEEEVCAWTDLSLLLPGSAWAAYRASSCRGRLPRLDTLWWLADPAWSVPGNDREVEHYARMVWATLHDDAMTGGSGDGRVADGVGHIRDHHVTVVRHGMDRVDRDSRWRPPTARTAYRVIPGEEALLNPFHAPPEAWPVEPGPASEDYVPRWGGFSMLEAQVAFFERGDSVEAAAAADVPRESGYRAADPDAVLFLHTGPEASPLRVEAAGREGRWTFRARAPRRRYVVGIEAELPGGIGRTRFGHGLPHDRVAPLRLSDLLLYTPDGGAPPDSLEAAVPLMRGNDRWRAGETMGVFLEVYGPEDVTSLPVTVELEAERGLLARLGEVVGFGGETGVNVNWSQPGAGGRVPVSFTLELRDVTEGEHTLRVSVGGPGMSPAVVERAIRVVRGG